MNQRNIIEAILFCLMVTVPIKGNFNSEICLFGVSTSRGKVSMQKCEAENFNKSALPRSIIHTKNMEASWAVSNDHEDRLLLKSSFLARGSGLLLLKLSSASKQENVLFCGVFQKSKADANFNAAINVWLQCKQDALHLEDKLTFSIDKMKGRSKRSLPEALNVDLPGCLIPQFKHTTLCHKEEEKKIRFHVRKISNRRSIRVVLSRAVYTSLFEDERRARGRRYNVAILEESPADVWLKPGEGKMLEMHKLQYPNRIVRFRNLEGRKTYEVAVWRYGEVKRYVQKITLC